MLQKRKRRLAPGNQAARYGGEDVGLAFVQVPIQRLFEQHTGDEQHEAGGTGLGDGISHALDQGR